MEKEYEFVSNNMHPYYMEMKVIVTFMIVAAMLKKEMMTSFGMVSFLVASLSRR
jgi:hypothetical protein